MWLLWKKGIRGLQRTLAANTFLQLHLNERRPYADSLDAYFGAVYVGGGARLLNAAPYEALKAQGLQLISSDTLRLRIVEVYENTYGGIRRQEEFNEGVLFEVLRPYYLLHFRNLRFALNATPRDYNALLADSDYSSILEYRADFVQRAMIDQYQGAITRIRSLILALEGELVDF